MRVLVAGGAVLRQADEPRRSLLQNAGLRVLVALGALTTQPGRTSARTFALE